MTKKLQNNEQGIAQILIIIIAVVVLGAVGFVGYKVATKNKSKTTSSSTATTNAVSSSCLSTYHDANICHFASFSTSFDKTAYTATITTTQQGTTSTLTMKNDGKGNTAMTGTSDGQQFNSILLDGNTYIGSGGTWMEYKSGSTAPTQSNPTSNMNIGVGTKGITFKNLGTDACGSQSCFKYQVTDAAMAGTTQYVWFDNSSYKLREWKYSDGSGNSTDMTISYGAVTITAPSPVQVIPTGQ
jgi:outer membrane lipoprotein-sorting protein